MLAAAMREAREEAGIDIRIDRLLNVYSYPGVAPVIIVYVATMTGGTLACDDECLEVRFFAPDEIPWDELAFPSTRIGARGIPAEVSSSGDRHFLCQVDVLDRR